MRHSTPALAAAFGLALAAADAHAQQVINLGNLVVSSNPTNINLAGLGPIAQATRVRVRVEWSAISPQPPLEPWSIEAIWALSNQEAPFTSPVVIYTDPGASPDGQSSNNPVVLNWDILLSRSVGPTTTPLWFSAVQTFEGSTAAWSNTTVTFDTPPAPAAPASINLGIVGNAPGPITIDTVGGTWDAQLALFNSWGGLVADDDQSGGGNQALIDVSDLEPGDYYIALSGFLTEYNRSIPFSATTAPGSEGGPIVGRVIASAGTFAFPAGVLAPGAVQWYRFTLSPAAPACYANCDASTGTPLLTPADFVCFLNKFRASDPYANCDASTGTPALTPADFVCFLNKFRAGC